MRSEDVIKFFDEIPVGTVVSILPEKLPHMHRYERPKAQPAPVPSPGPAKPVSQPEKPAEVVAHETSKPLQAAVAEKPAKENSIVSRAMKGSMLLATVRAEADKTEQHGGKTVAQ